MKFPPPILVKLQDGVSAISATNCHSLKTKFPLVSLAKQHAVEAGATECNTAFSSLCTSLLQNRTASFLSTINRGNKGRGDKQVSYSVYFLTALPTNTLSVYFISLKVGGNPARPLCHQHRITRRGHGPGRRGGRVVPPSCGGRG